MKKTNIKRAIKKASVFCLSFLMIFANVIQVNAVPQSMCEADIDVVAAVDRSGSMSPLFPPSYEDRIGAAKSAVDSFLSHLGLNDRSSLVSFSSNVILENGLTDNHSLTQANTNNLPALPVGSTNIGGAISTATNEIFNNGRPQASKVIILLTDGDSNTGPNPLTKANEAFALGIKIYTIGLGSAVNTSMLEQIAHVNSPNGGKYYHAPTPADLEAIYTDIRWQLCQLGSISGYKYETDYLGNNQATIPDWEIILEGDTIVSQSTDQNGYFQFSGLSPGPYVLREGANPGITYEQKYPTSNNGTYIVNLGEGDHFTYDFGNYFPICGDGTCDANYNEDCSTCPEDCGECVPDSVTIVATKIVCDNEESLPNWGAGGPNITETTATEFIAQNPGCHLQEGWSFQVGDQTAVKKDGDFYGEATAQEGWTTFGPTGLDGITQTTVILTQDITQLRLREVLQTGYIPFTYPPNTDPVSAEFYCHTDVYKYDNYDWIFQSELAVGEIYYCVAFNAEIYNPVYECSDGIDNDQDTLVDADDPGCWDDPTDPSTYDPTDDNEDNDSLPECSDFLDNDGDGDIDEDDATCFRNGYYDPTLDNEQNLQPVITLAQPTVTITVGDSFDPYGGYATADDVENGNITPDITETGVVDTSTVGIYPVDYNVNDSEGLAAETKTLTVIVEPVPIPDPYCGDGNCDDGECCSSCPQDCGQCYIPPTSPSSSGGGGLPILTIPEKGVCVVDENNVAHFSYRTNMMATTQVVCDTEYHLNMGIKPYYGYPLHTEEFDLLSDRVTNHEAELLLDMGVGTYYCRVIADGNYPGMVKEELTCLVQEVASISEEIPPVAEPCNCHPLLNTYIKLGAENNPNDVRALEWVLNEMGYPVPINSIYEQHDFEAVKQLQEDNSEAILVPWGINSTGYVYLTTQKFINEWYCDYRGCPREFPLTEDQEKEVNWYKGLYAVLTESLKIKK